jgi:hypothetical protein
MEKQRKRITELHIQLEEHRKLKELQKQEVLLRQRLEQEKNRKNINWQKESSRLKTLSLEGKTLKEIGEVYNVSGTRIGQVLAKYFPSLTSEQRGLAVLSTQKRQEYLSSLYLKTGRYTGHHADDLSRAMANCFSRKKQNAKKGKWEWLIGPTDITFPTHCPMLGMELDWFAESRQENSPSIDRVDSTKGYIPGNVIVCSWRANRIKNDGSSIEHRQIADYLDNYFI